MTSTSQNPVTCPSGAHTCWNLCSLKGEAELEKLDREAGHEYVPMDVFVDPRTMKEHFQGSSVRARWKDVHATAA